MCSAKMQTELIDRKPLDALCGAVKNCLPFVCRFIYLRDNVQAESISIYWPGKHLNLCIGLVKAPPFHGQPEFPLVRATGALKMHFKLHSSRVARRMQIEQCGCSSRDCTSILLHLTHWEGMEEEAEEASFPVLINIWSERSLLWIGHRKILNCHWRYSIWTVWSLTIFPSFLIRCIGGPCRGQCALRFGYKNFYNHPLTSNWRRKTAPICSATINWFPTLMHRSPDFDFLSFVPRCWRRYKICSGSLLFYYFFVCQCATVAVQCVNFISQLTQLLCSAARRRGVFGSLDPAPLSQPAPFLQPFALLVYLAWVRKNVEIKLNFSQVY